MILGLGVSTLSFHLHPVFGLLPGLALDQVEFGDDIEGLLGFRVVSGGLDQVASGVHPAGEQEVIWSGQGDELALFIHDLYTPPLAGSLSFERVVDHVIVSHDEPGVIFEELAGGGYAATGYDLKVDRFSVGESPDPPFFAFALTHHVPCGLVSVDQHGLQDAFMQGHQGGHQQDVEPFELDPEGLAGDLEPTARHALGLSVQRQVIQVLVDGDLHGEVFGVAATGHEGLGPRSGDDVLAVFAAVFLLFLNDDLVYGALDRDALALLKLTVHLLQTTTTDVASALGLYLFKEVKLGGAGEIGLRPGPFASGFFLFFFLAVIAGLFVLVVVPTAF